MKELMNLQLNQGLLRSFNDESDICRAEFPGSYFLPTSKGTEKIKRASEKSPRGESYP